MFEMRAMTPADRDAVMAMVTDFYHSPAVEHEVAFPPWSRRSGTQPTRPSP